MRLLHAKSRVLKEFLGSKPPKYAIISHRWSDEEISFQSFLDGDRKGYGWDKISKACEIALSRNIKWIWIDTICIDKKASAELSEAINSMFKWYRCSTECYALYLSAASFRDMLSPITAFPRYVVYRLMDSKLPDVFDTTECHCPEHGVTAFKERRTRSKLCMYRFNNSEWFTRGWCLQELLAPLTVLFFNARFQWIGSKLDLSSEISSITGINAYYLKDPDRIYEASVAERMRWASQRQTTREEDVAYSLLGVFDVNMPLLYGEGPKAFLRLQTEIIKKSDDETIFVWWLPLPQWKGLLAPKPSAFCMESIEPSSHEYRQHFAMTNKGIHFTVRIPESHKALSRNPRWATKIVFPLNVKQVRNAGCESEMTRRAAIKIFAVPNQNDRILRCERVIGVSPDVGIILVREKEYNPESRRLEFAYDEVDDLHNFGNLDDLRHDDAIYILNNGEDAGKEWHIYIPQDGL